jgi:hypothetical protein
MIFKQEMVSNLVQLYPSRWRREYGEELRATLLSEPLGLRVVWDVVAHAARENVRYPDPWVFGILFMLGWRVLWILLQPVSWLAAAAGHVDPWIENLTVGVITCWSVMRESGQRNGELRAIVSPLLAVTSGYVGSLILFRILMASGLFPSVDLPAKPAVLESFGYGLAVGILIQLTGLGLGRYLKRRLA